MFHIVNKSWDPGGREIGLEVTIGKRRWDFIWHKIPHLCQQPGDHLVNANGARVRSRRRPRVETKVVHLLYFIVGRYNLRWRGKYLQLANEGSGWKLSRQFAYGDYD